ncbi:ATP-binding protein [Saccharibacillus sacchari]|uniref:ATP-binding protein n=1 Tax=Saccharibacillus sacchari TaxID=456493 RepID=A0ACC6P7F0_9BACL
MMSYRKKQLLGFGVILFALMILLFVLAAMLDGVRQNLSEIMDECYDKVSRSAAFRNNFAYLDSEVGYLINENDPQQSSSHMAQIDRRSQAAYTHLFYLQLHIGKDGNGVLLGSIQQGLERYMDVVERIDNVLDQGDSEGASVLFVEEAQGIRTNLLRNLDEYTTMQENKMQAAQQEADQRFSHILMVSAISALAIILIGVASATWVIRGTGRSLRRVTDLMDQFDPGAVEHMPRLSVDTNDEIGNIAHGYNHMLGALEDHNRRVGEFNQRIEDNNWLQTKLNELVLLYHQVPNQEALAGMFLAIVAPAVHASSGLFYIREKKEEQISFTRIASYADDGPQDTQKRFLPGEGLIGQAAIDGQEILIDIPDNYPGLMRAGSGRFRPKQLWIIPIEAEDRVEAVVELASLQPFSPLHRQLIEQLRSTLGIALQSVSGRAEVDRLLHEAQSMTEELRRSSQYKSEFLANMSHELRTPLNSILILSQLIAENPEEAETEGKSYAEIIHRSGEDLLSIVNDVLDLSKVEAGMLDINQEAFSLRDFPELLHYGFDALAKQKNIHFEISLAEDLPDFFYTDGKRLQQIIKNLLSNAFKFTQTGTVSCTLHPIDIQELPCIAPDARVDPNRNAIAITVQDTGIGIAEDKREVIFEAFRQADGSTERMYGGTGLGLSICREFARLLGGCITLDSVEGQGSSFTLYLPEMPES